MKHLVYLAGPITGLTFQDGSTWRDIVANDLNSDKIECLSPLRGKEFLKSEGILHSGTYDGTLASSKGIMRRDHRDCIKASALFVNLIGSTKVSIGTVMECAWAYDRQIPVVLIMESNNLHNHVMLNESATYIVETLEQGVNILKVLFNEA